MQFDMQSMLAQAQKMQEEMEKVKKEVEAKIITAESGGGMVTVTMNGAQDIKSIKIAKEAVDPRDVEMLEDLIVAAINKANKEAKDLASNQMGGLSGMLPKIPGLNL